MPIGSQQALDGLVLDRYDQRVRAALRPLLTAEVIDEHHRDPLAVPSDSLRRVLTYFGNLPVDGKLVTEHDGAGGWYVCRIIGSPAVRVDRVAGPLESQSAALVQVFDRRLAEVFGIEAEA